MSGVLRWAATGLAAVVLIAAGALIAQDAVHRGIGEPTLWTTGSSGVLWLVGAALIAASALTRGAERSVLLALLAIAWLAPMFSWWSGGTDPLVVAVAPAVATLALPALWHLLLGATAARSAARTVALATVWIATAAAAALLVVVRDPFLDARCRGVCSPNPVLIVAVPNLVTSAHLALAVLSVAVGLASAVWSIGFLIRKRLWMPLTPAPALVVIALTVIAAETAPADGASPLPPAEAWLAACLALVAVTALSASIAALGRRAALRRLADDLASGTGSQLADLRARLAAVLHDPTVDVLYPLEGGRWVDATGIARPLPEGGVASVRRQGVTVAMVVGNTDRLRDLETIGAAASLAIDNERLRAGISARLAELRASRLHVVEAGDDERRRIERNLHDGMQQSLLVLQYELALAASQDADPGRQAELARLRGEAHRITERLRTLARGVFPAALDDLGVAAALQRLADDATFPLELSGEVEPRPPRPIERTLYLVADEALAGGMSAPGTLTIAVERAPDAVTLRTTNASAAASSTLRDRIEALGGRLDAIDGGIEVMLPCASS